MLGRLCRALDGLRATRLWQDLDARGRVSLLTHSGPWVGGFWTAGALRWARPANCQWRTALRRRLGAPVVQGDARCQLTRQSADPDAGEAPCAAPLDVWGDHALACPSKEGRLRVHHAIAQGLAVELRQLGGATVVCEKRVPELHQRTEAGEVVEAILDLEVGWPATVGAHWVDVHLRTPFSADAAQSTAGLAAEAGDRRKVKRYGPSVLPFGVEVGGRLSRQAVAACAGLARDAVEWGWRPGRRQVTLTARRLAMRASTLAELGAAGIVLAAVGG